MRIWEKWNIEWKIAIEGKTAENLILRFLTSHTALAFCYGLFLFLYEVKFARDIVTPVHPVLIAWAGTLVLYDVFVRNIWKQVPYWVPVFLFTVSTGITTILTMEVGLVSGIKGMIFTALPLYAFFPVCLLQEKSKRRNTFILSLLGAAVVIFVASAVALGLYAVRFGGYVDIGSMREFVGMRFYIPTDPTTGILLYGFYVDTNHAAMFALAFIAYGIYLFVSGCQGAFDRRWKNVSAIVFGALSAIVQLCYFPMANSRAGWLALLIGMFVVVFIAAFCTAFAGKKAATKVFLSGLVAVVTVMCIFFGMQILRDGIAKLPDVVEQITVSIRSARKPVTTVTVSDDFKTMTVDYTDGQSHENVQFAVWSNVNGQDDLHWYSASQIDAGKWHYTVDLTAHNSAGEYTIHVYAVDGETYVKLAENITYVASASAAPSETLEIPATSAVPETTAPAEVSTEDKTATDMELVDTTDVSDISFDKGQVSLDGSRFLIWKEALQLFAKKPIFGTSPSGNQYFAQKYQVGMTKLANGAAVHNSFLDLLLDYGLVGFVLAMSFWVMCAVAVLRNRFKKLSPNDNVWYAAVFTIIVTLCASMTLSCTFINTTAMYFLMIVAASYLMSEIQ